MGLVEDDDTVFDDIRVSFYQAAVQDVVVGHEDKVGFLLYLEGVIVRTEPVFLAFFLDHIRVYYLMLVPLSLHQVQVVCFGLVILACTLFLFVVAWSSNFFVLLLYL